MPLGIGYLMLKSVPTDSKTNSRKSTPVKIDITSQFRRARYAVLELVPRPILENEDMVQPIPITDPNFRKRF